MAMPMKRLGCGLKVSVGDTERERRPGARSWSLYSKEDYKGKLANSCATCGGHELNLPKIVDLPWWLENRPANGRYEEYKRTLMSMDFFFLYQFNPFIFCMVLSTIYIPKAYFPLLQFVYSVAGIALGLIFGTLLLLLNMRYGSHDFRYFSKNKKVGDLASPSFLRKLAKKRKTQGVMVYALLAYIGAMLFAQYVPTLLAISEDTGLDTVNVYNTTLVQPPTPAWSRLNNDGKMGNSDPTQQQTEMLYDLFHKLDPIYQLNNMSFNQRQFVQYTPLQGSQMSEFNAATDNSANLWTNYNNTQPHLTNASLTFTGISYSEGWTVTNYQYTTEGDWSYFLYRPQNLYRTFVEPLRPPSELFDPYFTSMAWTNEYAGSWSFTNKSYLWSSLTYGLISPSPQNISNFDFFTNLAAMGDNGTGVCVEQTHISSLLAAVPTTYSTNTAFAQWNNSDSVCELRAVVFVNEFGTTVMLAASKTKVTRADFTYGPWVVEPGLGYNAAPPSPMGQVLDSVANTKPSKAPNNLLISADSYLLEPSQQGSLVNTTPTAILLRSRLVDPAIDSPGRDALFLTSVVSNASLVIPMILTINVEAIESPIWVPILSGTLVLIAIALIVFRGKISGDWDLDLYVLFMDTAEAVGDFGDLGDEMERQLEVCYDPETGRNILATPKAMFTDTILENIIPDDKRDMAEDLIEKYSPVDQPLKKASGFLVDTYTTADLKKAVAKIKKAKHDLSAKKSHLKILDTVAQNCVITKEISKKGIDVKDLWELLQEVDFAKVLSLTQKAALAKPKVKVSDIERIV